MLLRLIELSSPRGDARQRRLPAEVPKIFFAGVDLRILQRRSECPFWYH